LARYFNIIRPKGEPDTSNPIPDRTDRSGPLANFASNLILIDGFDSFIDTTIYGQGIQIGRNFILTAGHVSELYNTKKNVNLYYSNGLGRPKETNLKASKVYQLKGYSGANRPDKDLALIQLSTERDVQSVPISKLNNHEIAQPVRLLAFWGRGWWNFRGFEHQYSAVGFRTQVPLDITSSTYGSHNARTLKMWSGAPVFGYVNSEFKFIGVHGNYLKGIANLFCAFDQTLHDEVSSLSVGSEINTNLWRNTWNAPSTLV